MREHAIERLWVRAAPGAAVDERTTLDVEDGAGIVGDHTFGRLRHVTIVFADDWRRATDALGRDVDPSARRANVLLSGGGGRRYIGKSVRLGDVTLEIKGEVAPCPTMDAAADGLMDALRPDCRAGVWARVLSGGTLRPGDGLMVVDAPASTRGRQGPAPA